MQKLDEALREKNCKFANKKNYLNKFCTPRWLKNLPAHKKSYRDDLPEFEFIMRKNEEDDLEESFYTQLRYLSIFKQC